DRYALVFDRIDPRHAHVLEHLEVLDVVVRKSHPEADALESRDILDQRLFFLVVDQVGLPRAYVGEIDHSGDAEWIDVDPFAALPELPALRHFADVDL